MRRLISLEWLQLPRTRGHVSQSVQQCPKYGALGCGLRFTRLELVVLALTRSLVDRDPSNEYQAGLRSVRDAQ